ncbi:MAG: sugar phosphate isomerase/epimerase [Clostridiales bacterium]|nr:sugar phosphate isomerase/epimerase [Clostridiales bacterium]
MRDQVKIFAFTDEAGNTLEQQMNAMKRNGLHGMEMRFINGHNVSALPLEQAREIKKVLDGEGLTVWSLGSPIGKIGIRDDFAPHLDQFKYILDVAYTLQAENVRMFSFYMEGDKDPAIFRDEVLERLAKLLEAAKGSNINLCHENEKGIYGDNAARCADILSQLPELKAVFDPANFVQCGQDTLEAWQLLADRIHYMHIKDALEDGSVVPAGCGNGHVPEIVAEYIARGGRALSVEPHLQVFKGLDTLEAEGQRTKLGKYEYPDADTAFDAACSAIKAIVEKI